MVSNKEKESWTVDQITKTEFFHQKLHEWGLLEIAYELEKIKGENLKWETKELNITDKAWDKVIHRGIKPIRVFSHPEVLKQNPKRVGYYRMLAMVSQKSMGRLGLSITKYEEAGHQFNNQIAVSFTRHLNKIISILIEHDEKIDPREFDIWRGMAAGSQAQGSWQNTKGDRAEVVIKDLIERRIREKELALEVISHGKGKKITLKDGRLFILASEPDIGVYENDSTQIALEIKGGIDSAGVLERFGAALKSLRRSKQENLKSITILVMQRVSLIPKATQEIKGSKTTIDHFFTVEEIIENTASRKRLFTILKI